MSHQTGIKANEQLKKFFSKCKDGKFRIFKVAIEDEQLVLKEHNNEKHNWEKDYEKYVVPLIEENQPCYILYRLDSKNSLGYEWLLISWCPDSAPVRQKMLYASTKATLKQEFGSSQIKEELHGTILSDITLDGYKRHKMNVAAPAPLSMREEELQELKKTEIHTEISISTKQQTLGGVAFPLTETAIQAFADMARGAYNYLQLRIDDVHRSTSVYNMAVSNTKDNNADQFDVRKNVKTNDACVQTTYLDYADYSDHKDISEETIHLASAENISLEKLPSKIPSDSARYHLYLFKFTHEGDYTENLVFIYSMPGYSCSVKERMLYSSCKNPLTDTIATLGLEIVKKIEIDSGSELTEQFLYDQLHPTNSLHRPKFLKPKGPPGRGPKRMTKNQ